MRALAPEGLATAARQSICETGARTFPLELQLLAHRGCGLHADRGKSLAGNV